MKRKKSIFPNKTPTEEKFKLLKPLILKYYNENKKLDERGIDKCDYLPSCGTIKNIVRKYFDLNKSDCVNLYEVFNLEIPQEYYDTYFNRNKYTYDEINNIFTERGYKLLSQSFNNTSVKVEYICPYGHTGQITINDFINGHRCKTCGIESGINKRKLSTEYIQSFYASKGCVVFNVEDSYKNKDSQLVFQCSCGEIDICSFASFKLTGRCRLCGKKSISKEKHYAWKGGISPLHEYLRKHITEWKQLSAKKCNYKCVITGTQMEAIHHLYSFNKILSETLIVSNLDLRDSIEKYTTEELDLLVNNCNSLHKQYGLGVCLNNDIHKLFHKIYKDDNIPEQFEEFIQRLKSGEFDDFLKGHNYKLII